MRGGVGDIHSKNLTRVEQRNHNFQRHGRVAETRPCFSFENNVRYGHPAANLFRKHWKSLALRMGGAVELSQLA